MTKQHSGPSSFKQRRRAVFQWRRYLADVACWASALVLGALIRYEGALYAIDWPAVLTLMVMAAVLQLIAGQAFMLYWGRYPWGSFRGFFDVVATAGLTTGVIWLWTAVVPQYARVPQSLVLIAGPIAILLMAATHYTVRSYQESQSRVREGATPVIIYGAGYVGNALTRMLTTDPQAKLWPAAVLDDDRSKQQLRLHGVKVEGSLADLKEVAATTSAQVIIIAIGDPKPELLERVRTLAKASDLRVQVMPPIAQMLQTGVNTSDLRDLDIEDLLGRAQVDTDVSAIASYLNGKRVLVTGAGGSIGQQLCWEINKHGPSELILLDRDETGLQLTEILLRGNGLLDSKEAVLADIRDGETITEIFEERRPEVVFHAAALKHLPMLEKYPDEAWQTNVLGTLNVLQAARKIGVEVLINISTDKAANPTSVLGLSKRLAERLTSWAGSESGARYLSVRFGNVLGSRGSMLPTFRKLIEEGKPLTVTHPDITRYFMTIPEACQLVLQAGAIGRTGEVLILDMGEPVKILDIAQKMIALSGKQVEIRFTGLREGEKLHEDLHNLVEVDSSPFHEKISHADVIGLSGEDLLKVDWDELIATEPNDRPLSVRKAEGEG